MINNKKTQKIIVREGWVLPKTAPGWCREKQMLAGPFSPDKCVRARVHVFSFNKGSQIGQTKDIFQNDNIQFISAGS